jgi:3-deoxy-D-manno-octulosonate 8-phosphate phosphatase (KDO 8-P phosphatase)
MPVLLRSDEDLAKSITCIVSDVDGVMTDGKIVYDSAGVEIKSFHVRDGLGIKLWMRSGFGFGILTARTSDVVVRRSEELGVDHVVQGSGDKLAASKSLFDAIGCAAEQVCYIGDDLPDLRVMKSVGLAVAPADAVVEVREGAHWILRGRGGEGVVRELVERLLRAKHRWEEHLPH